MSVQLRWEQCCESHGCTRPARYGDLCTSCYLGSTPAQRAVELAGGGPPRGRGPAPTPAPPDVAADFVDGAGAAWLSALWDASVRVP